MIKSNNLPDGWIWSKLGDVCEKPQYGWTTKATSEGNLHLLRTTDITPGFIDWNTVPFCTKVPEDKEKYLLKDGDLVISRAGSVGYSYLIRQPQEAVFASYLIRFKPISTDERYVAYFLQSPDYWQAISETKLGIAIPNVNATKLSNIDIPIPPLSEQKRIVSKIEELFTQLDTGVADLQQAKARLKRYRQAVLKAAVEGELTREWREAHKEELEPADVLLNRILAERRAKWEVENWEKEIERAKKKTAQARRKAVGRPSRISDLNPDDWKKIPKDEYIHYLPKNENWKLKYNEPEPPDTDDLPELPKCWIWATTKSICYRVTDGFHRTPKPTMIGVPYILATHVKPDGIDFKNCLYVSQQDHDRLYKKTGVKRNDILYVNIGIGSGTPAIVDVDFKFSFKNVAILKKSNLFHAKYLLYFLMSERKRLYHKITQGGAQPFVSLERLRKIIISIPPYEEQKRIVQMIERRLSVTDEIEKEINHSLAQTDRLRQSILTRAFEGTLTHHKSTKE